MKKTLFYLKKYLWDSLIGNIIIVFLFINYGWQSFIIPSASMEKTLMTGDLLFANKHAFGLLKPVIPILEIPLTPKSNNNYLLEFKKPTRGEIIIFHPPFDNKTFFVKRIVAKTGDLVFFKNKHLFISFSEIPDIKNIDKCETIKIGNKVFYKEPYKNAYSSIVNDQNIPTINTFVSRPKNMANLSPDLKQNLENNHVLFNISNFPTKNDLSNYSIEGQDMLLIKGDEYFMIGDNRDHSSDSRFWGTINFKHIAGTPSIVFFSFDWDKKEIRWDRIGKMQFEVNRI